jgi:hypothetical protein
MTRTREEIERLTHEVYAAASRALVDPAFAASLPLPVRADDALKSLYVSWLEAAARQLVPAERFRWAVVQTIGGNGYLHITPIDAAEGAEIDD